MFLFVLKSVINRTVLSFILLLTITVFLCVMQLFAVLVGANDQLYRRFSLRERVTHQEIDDAKRLKFRLSQFFNFFHFFCNKRSVIFVIVFIYFIMIYFLRIDISKLDQFLVFLTLMLIFVSSKKIDNIYKSIKDFQLNYTKNFQNLWMMKEQRLFCRIRLCSNG